MLPALTTSQVLLQLKNKIQWNGRDSEPRNPSRAWHAVCQLLQGSRKNSGSRGECRALQTPMMGGRNSCFCLPRTLRECFFSLSRNASERWQAELSNQLKPCALCLILWSLAAQALCIASITMPIFQQYLLLSEPAGSLGLGSRLRWI